MNVVVKAGQASMLVQDVSHVPLLELSLGSGAQLQLPPQAWPGDARSPPAMRRVRPIVLHSAETYRYLLACPAVEAGVRGPSQQVVQAYLGFKLGVWSYNGAVKHWEPVVEPWDVIAQCAANYGSRVGALTGFHTA